MNNLEKTGKTEVEPSLDSLRDEFKEKVAEAKKEYNKKNKGGVNEGGAKRHLAEIKEGYIDLVPGRYLQLWSDIKNENNMDETTYEKYLEKVDKIILEEDANKETTEVLNEVRPLITQELVKKRLEMNTREHKEVK